MSESDGNEEENWMDTNWADPCETGQTRASDPVQTCIQSNAQKSKENSSATTMECPNDVPDKANKENSTGLMNRMRLNDNKAGMNGLDKEKINQIILEASKGSRFYENERKKEEQMNKKIEEQKMKLKQITPTQLKQGQIEADKLLAELEDSRDLSRTIVHVDMDAFYAAVAMRDNPSLKEKPMAVGGMSMLSTSNYHARKFGVRAAMPGFIAKKLCPELIIVPLNFDKYTEVSKQVREILADYDPNFSPMSLDEAYLDMTEHLKKRSQLSHYERTFLCRKTDGCSETLCNCDLNLKLKPLILKHEIEGKKKKSEKTEDEKKPTTCPLCGRPYPEFDLVTFGMSPDDSVNEMRARIEQKTRLTASAGIAPNTMLAKVCSDRNKPNGQYRIIPEKDQVMEFITDLPTRKICGIGKVSETMLNALDIYTCSDLYSQRALLYHLYSEISFNYFMRICLGIGSTFVERDSERKSISTERTFSEISKPVDLYNKCEELSQALSEDLKDEELKGKTVSIKIKTVEFELKTRANTIADYTNDADDIFVAAKELLKTEIQAVAPQPLRLRLMGVRMSSLLHQSLCKKKQNTIRGFIKRMATGKAKKESDKSSDTEILCTIPDTCQINNEGVKCDDQLTDDNENNVDGNFNLSGNKQIDQNRDQCDTTILETNADLEKNSSSDSDCNNERGLEFNENLIHCHDSGTECSGNNYDCKIDCDKKLDKKSGFIQDTRNKSLSLPLNNKCLSEVSNIDELVCKEESAIVKACRDTKVVSDEIENYICPVCQNIIECKDLVKFNHHIDVCLNSKVVKDCTRFANEEDRSSKKVVSSPTTNTVVKPSPKNKSKKNSKPFSPISSALVSKFCKQKEASSDVEIVDDSHIEGKSSRTKDGSVVHGSGNELIDSDAKKVLSCANGQENISTNEKKLNDKQKTKASTSKTNTKLVIQNPKDCVLEENIKLEKSSDQTEVMDILNSSRSLVCPVCFMEQKGNNLDVFNEHVDTCLSKDAITQIVKIENDNNTKSQKRTLENTPEKPGKKRQKKDTGLRTIDSFFKV